MKGILGYDSTYCVVLAGRLPCPQFLRSGKVKNIFQKSHYRQDKFPVFVMVIKKEFFFR